MNRITKRRCNLARPLGLDFEQRPGPIELKSAAPSALIADFTAFVGLERRLERLASEDWSAPMRAIADRALIYTRSTGAAVALLQGDEMVCVAASGSNAPSLGARLKAGFGFSGACIRSATLLRCDDSEYDERVDRESCHVLGVRSLLAVPINSNTRVTGLLEVCSSRPKNFGANDEIVLSSLATILETVLSGSTAAPTNLNCEPLQERPTRVQQSQSSRLPMDESQVRAAPTFHKKILSALTWPVMMASIPVLALAFWFVGHPLELWKGMSSRWTTQSQSGPLDHTLDVSKMPAIRAYANDLGTIRRMAEEGDPAAQFALGTKFAIGEEVPQNYSEAARWFSSAAEQGHSTAQTILAAYYVMGRGVRQDLTKAYFWSVLAEAGHDPSSKYRLFVLSSKMSASQIRAAQEQAKDWLKQRKALKVKPAQVNETFRSIVDRH